MDPEKKQKRKKDAGRNEREAGEVGGTTPNTRGRPDELAVPLGQDERTPSDPRTG